MDGINCGLIVWDKVNIKFGKLNYEFICLIWLVKQKIFKFIISEKYF